MDLILPLTVLTVYIYIIFNARPPRHPPKDLKDSSANWSEVITLLTFR